MHAMYLNLMFINPRPPPRRGRLRRPLYTAVVDPPPPAKNPGSAPATLYIILGWIYITILHYTIVYSVVQVATIYIYIILHICCTVL